MQNVKCPLFEKGNNINQNSRNVFNAEDGEVALFDKIFLIICLERLNERKLWQMMYVQNRYKYRLRYKYSF